MLKRLILPLLLITACGSEERIDKRTHNHGPTQTELDDIKKQLLQLQQELASIAASDYANCDGALSTVAQNICKIAQAATVEVRVEMQGAITELANQLESKILDAQADFHTMSTSWKQMYGVDFPDTTGAPVPSAADCIANNANASLVQCMIVQGNAISALENSLSVLTGVVAGAMVAVQVGVENDLAGPVYETLLRLGDQSRINAYTNGMGPIYGVPGNPLQVSNGSATITVTTTPLHGLSIGDKVTMEGCASGRGFTSQQLNDTFVLVTVPSTTTFTITASSTATSNGSMGGAGCIIREYTGSGMATIWEEGDGSDVAVRVTNGGSKSYNFAVCETGGGDGKICYDQTNRLASFATISTGWALCAGSGNILCK